MDYLLRQNEEILIFNNEEGGEGEREGEGESPIIKKNILLERENSRLFRKYI